MSHLPEDDASVSWDDISFIISSSYRIAVLENLARGPATPSQLASDTNSAIAHVSRALQELRDRSLVELLVSENRKKGRVYGITAEAKQIWKTIENESLV